MRPQAASAPHVAMLQRLAGGRRTRSPANAACASRRSRPWPNPPPTRGWREDWIRREQTPGPFVRTGAGYERAGTHGLCAPPSHSRTGGGTIRPTASATSSSTSAIARRGASGARCWSAIARSGALWHCPESAWTQLFSTRRDHHLFTILGAADRTSTASSGTDTCHGLSNSRETPSA